MKSVNRIICAALLLVVSLTSCDNSVDEFGTPSSLSLPSDLALVEYEKELYPWIGEFNYKEVGWSVDKGVRDTGPFIESASYGTHGAVRIFYSPKMMEWLTYGRDRGEPIADGAMIIKEMYTPPAAIYTELLNSPEYTGDKVAYEKMLEKVITSWVVMVKDKRLAHDGWFWGSVEIASAGKSLQESIANPMLDTAENRGVTQLRWSGTAMPCMRCHASAEKELTFSDLANVEGYDKESPLVFRIDDSWRTPDHFTSFPLCNIKQSDYLSKHMIIGSNKSPTAYECPQAVLDTTNLKDHSVNNNAPFTAPSKPNLKPNQTFLTTFDEIPAATLTPTNMTAWTFPPEWMDHVVMPADHQTDYITSDNCLGCHGGLAGSANRDVMYIPRTDPNKDKHKNGYNVSEYGEWRWSPMGLAGRDPIFHAQLESEMALLKRDSEIDKRHPDTPLLADSLDASQQAITNKCLTCHGAMGERQLQIDTKAALAPGEKFSPAPFKMDYFYLPEVLTKEDKANQRKKNSSPDNVRYGALAREGISCMICHRIDNPDPKKVKSWQPKEGWITEETDKTLAYNLFHHSSGEFRRGPIDQVFGPFDVAQKPMQHSFGLSPIRNDYITDSQMCGSCHTINLPNIGSTSDDRPVLDAAAEEPFKDYKHSIEQATFVEWQNSAFSVGKPQNEDLNSTFKSCQECHMPSEFLDFDGSTDDVTPLLTQIATIQDSSYPEAGNSLPNKDIDIPVRNNYKRHTHVGLNVFLLSMVDQFSDLLGLYKTDYMTGVDNGVDLALDSMIQQAQKSTVNLTVDVPNAAEAISKNGVLGKQITAKVNVSNLTGHRYPSGVAFRRAFLELKVTDVSGTKVLWQSGGTNEVGVILDGYKGRQLKTEFLPNTIVGENNKPVKLPHPRPTEKQCFKLLADNDVHYQPHHQVITEQSQVQIYEELNLNAQCGFTTSFVHRVFPIKDNRLLPKGWRESRFFRDQGEVIYEFMQATDPEGKAKYQDKDYANPKHELSFAGDDNLKYQVFIPDSDYQGALIVTATLYNQSIPPYWLKHRFDEAPDGKATKRLHYMASHLDLEGTAMEHWKLKLQSADAPVPQ